MKERWGGGEKGFKLIFTARKELVIHTIWGERAFEAARLPPARRLWSQAGTLRPDRVLPSFQPCFAPLFSPCPKHPMKPNCWARPPSTCAFFYRGQNKRQSFTTPALLYYSTPSAPIPAPPPSNIHMWFLFNPSEMVAGSAGRCGGERRGGMRLFIKCQPFKLIPLMDSPTSWCAFK